MAFSKLLFNYLQVTNTMAVEKEVATNADVDAIATIVGTGGISYSTEEITLAKSFLTSMKSSNMLVFSLGTNTVGRTVKIVARNIVNLILFELDLTLITKVGI